MSPRAHLQCITAPLWTPYGWSMQTVLIVEDEADLVSVLQYNISGSGRRAIVALRGADAVVQAREHVPDLILLDLMLPDVSGVEIARQLRADPRTAQLPILMLSARGGDIDRIVGFEVGADDYVTKPFSVRELLLRIDALLRRTRRTEARALLRFGDIAIDTEGHRAFVGGEEVALTRLELQLLRVLIERKGRLQTRARLLEDVWRLSPEITSRTVDTHINRLRQKLGAAGAALETVRGVGYRIAESPAGA